MVCAAIELEDGARRASATAMFEAPTRERNALADLDAGSADGEARHVYGDPNTLVRLTAPPGIDLDGVSRCRCCHRLFNTLEPLAWTNFQSRGGHTRPAKQQQQAAQAA